LLLLSGTNRFIFCLSSYRSNFAGYFRNLISHTFWRYSLSVGFIQSALCISFAYRLCFAQRFLSQFPLPAQLTGQIFRQVIYLLFGSSEKQTGQKTNTQEPNSYSKRILFHRNLKPIA
jgi:hypothetical protein